MPGDERQSSSDNGELPSPTLPPDTVTAVPPEPISPPVVAPAAPDFEDEKGD